MWPYGYTYTDVPADMTTRRPRRARIGSARRWPRPTATSPSRRATCTSRRARPATTCTGCYRVFSYTFEMSVKDYLDDSLIASETGPEQGGGPVPDRACLVPARGPRGGDADRALRRRSTTTSRSHEGWALDPYGTDTAPMSARWNRGDPAATSAGGLRCSWAPLRRGSRDFSTGLAAGSSANGYDLDGVSTIRSTPITLASSGHQRLSFRWSFAHDGHATAAPTR